MFHVAIEFKNPEKGQQFLMELVPRLKGAGTIVSTGQGPFVPKQKKQYKSDESAQRAARSTPESWARTAWFCSVNNKTDWNAERSMLSALKKSGGEKFRKINDEFKQFIRWMSKIKQLSIDETYDFIRNSWKKDREALSVLAHEHRLRDLAGTQRFRSAGRNMNRPRPR